MPTEAAGYRANALPVEQWVRIDETLDESGYLVEAC
jgi:hypothetical protein